MAKEHERILAWQKADALAVAIFKIVRGFPQGENTIGPALRKAVLSVPAQITVANGLRGRAEAFRCAQQAITGVVEVDYLLRFALRMGYLKDSIFEKIKGPVEELLDLVWDFHQALEL